MRDSWKAQIDSHQTEPGGFYKFVSGNSKYHAMGEATASLVRMLIFSMRNFKCLHVESYEIAFIVYIRLRNLKQIIIHPSTRPPYGRLLC